MKTKLISLLVAGSFAFGLSASIDENFEAIDHQANEQLEAIDQNDELVLSEENNELLLGSVGEAIGNAVSSVGGAIVNTFDWAKNKVSSAKDLVKSGFSKAAKVAEEMGVTRFIKDIPLKVLQKGEEATINFLYNAAKFGLSIAKDMVIDTLLPGLGNAITAGA